MGWLGKLIKGAAGLIPGVGTGLDILSAGAGLIGGNKAQGKSNDLLKRAMALKQQGWDARAPLRARSLELANQPMVGREDLSSVFSDPGNPYARSIPRPLAPQNTATPVAPVPQPMPQPAPVPGRPPLKDPRMQGLLKMAMARRQGLM